MVKNQNIPWDLTTPGSYDVETADIRYIHTKAQKELSTLSGHSLLLVGAGGFLGYYFIKSILAWNDTHKKKIQLTALSTFQSGIPPWMKQEEKRKDFRILSRDITSYTIPMTDSYDYIIHAASHASPIVYRKRPLETMMASVEGLKKVTTYMVGTKRVKGLLYFSSSEVYGNPDVDHIPTSEEYQGNVSFTGPRACYDESKRFCETFCSTLVRSIRLPIKIARPFNNYGPGMKITDGRVIADICQNIVSDKDIVLFSNGEDTRTFCYVTDAIVGYLKVLVNGKVGNAYNIGTESPEISVYDLASGLQEIAKRAFWYKGKISRQKSSDSDYLVDNPKRRCPNIQKARKEIGYNPEVTLEEGLLYSLLWYRNYPETL